jgi:hypothetical protein
MKSRYEAAVEAINAVFSDRGHSLNITYESLRSLRDEIDILIDAVRNDIRQEEKEEE